MIQLALAQQERRVSRSKGNGVAGVERQLLHGRSNSVARDPPGLILRRRSNQKLLYIA
jgi:hypothetical protein